MSGWYSWFFLTLYLTDNLLLSMSFIAFMMSAGRIINAVTEFLSGFIIDRTHTKIGKARPYDPGYIIFCCTSCIYGVQLPAQSGTDEKNGMGICLLSDAYCSVRGSHQYRDCYAVD